MKSIDDTSEVTGLLVAMIPVTDLAKSANWYGELLGLQYWREFRNDQQITGCALYHPDLRYGISFRLRSSTAGGADLRGEHPIILRCTDEQSLARMRTRAEELGLAPTGGRHADGEWLEVIDPDGIALRFVRPTAVARFVGVHVAADGTHSLYHAPQLISQ